MGPAVGVAVVGAVLLVLPIGSLWIASRWRDPPRERWGVPETARQAAADLPELAE